MQEFGKNVKVDIQKNELIIKVNLNEETTLSKSGKSMVIASTLGNVKIQHGETEINLGLNLYKKK
jgi:hypothetical protein